MSRIRSGEGGEREHGEDCKDNSLDEADEIKIVEEVK